jgi:ubiquinone/menaquinone biosynthesis C-methylase UbiE
MSSMMESKLTPEQHAAIRKVLVAQTESLGYLEAPIVAALLKERSCRSVLDIGCGEGSFLLKIASAIKGAQFLGIDQNELAIRDALRLMKPKSVRNVDLEAAFFDRTFRRTRFDAIITRYTTQHSSQPEDFVRSAYERLKRKGTFVAIESLDDYMDCHVHDAVWERYKSKLDAVHERVGSNNNMGKSLGLLLSKAGFRDVRVQAVLCSPSTVGWKRFSRVVQASANLAFSFLPDIFDRQLHQDVTAWLGNRKSVEERDPYLCTAIAFGHRQ